MTNPFDQFDTPQEANPFDRFEPQKGVRLYNPNPEAPSVSGAPSGTYQNGKRIGDVKSDYYDTVDLPEMADQAARKGTNSLIRGFAFPFDFTNNASNYFRGTNIPPLSDKFTLPVPAAKSLGGDMAGSVGSSLGDVASTILTGKAMGGGSPRLTGAQRAGMPTIASAQNTSVPQIVADALAGKPLMQAGVTTGGTVAGDTSGDPRIGAAVSLGLPMLAHGAQRTVSAAPAASTQEAERRALLQFGSDNELGPLTAGKILGSRKLQTAESAVSKIPIPFLGGRVQAAEEEGRNAWQRKAIEAAGTTTGETAATPGVLAKTRGRIGQVFDGLENGTTVNIDGQFGADIAKAKGDFSKQLLDQMPQSIVNKLEELSEAHAVTGQPGVMGVSLDGATYKNIRSKLSGQLSRASGTDREAIGGMIDALDGAMERSVPKDMAGDWKRARQQWRNYLALEKSVGANNEQTAVGNMSPASFGRASRGNADIERLGRYGTAFVGDKIPNSGTAERSSITHLLGAGAGLYEGLQHAPGMTMGALGAASVPFLLDGAVNNPLTRALLLARYRNSSAPIATRGLFGATTVNTAKQVE